MALDERYRRQVDLLLRLIPGVAAEPCFALKGGTAINLFVRNAPRLSVDISTVLGEQHIHGLQQLRALVDRSEFKLLGHRGQQRQRDLLIKEPIPLDAH